MPVKAGLPGFVHPGIMASAATPKPISLLPREHGAYAQLGIALAAGLALAPASPRAWTQALATALVFLASEPFLVMTGRRGEAARQQGALPARHRLSEYALFLLPALAWAWHGASVRQALSILPGSAFGLGLLALFLAKREHSMPGELLAAAAFAFTSLPVGVLGGAAPSKAMALALGLAVLNGLGTILVRGFLGSLKRGGSRILQALPVLLGLALSASAIVAHLPWLLALAPIPLTAAALWVVLTPPSPRELRRVGWVLAGASALGALLLVVPLR